MIKFEFKNKEYTVDDEGNLIENQPLLKDIVDTISRHFTPDKGFLCGYIASRLSMIIW